MQAIQQQVEYYFELAEKYFNLGLRRPEILLNLRGMAAGSADFNRYRLRFNPVLYAENREHFLVQVVGHEVAHLITFALHGRVQPHGKEWQQVMTQVFALPAHRLHNYEITSVQGRRFEYRCQCQCHQLSTRRHNAITRGAIYHCTLCHAPLVLVD